MERINFGELLKEVKVRKLTTIELEALVRELENPFSLEDKYTLIHILGKASADQYRAVVEKYLDYEDDPMITKIALQVLCDFWGLSEKYIDKVKKFVDGVKWDTSNDVKLIAISVAGEYLRENKDKEFFGKLVTLMEDTTEDELIRLDAYSALARAVGVGWNELPSPIKLHITKLNPDIIQRIKKAY